MKDISFVEAVVAMGTEITSLRTKLSESLEENARLTACTEELERNVRVLEQKVAASKTQSKK